MISNYNPVHKYYHIMYFIIILNNIEYFRVFYNILRIGVNIRIVFMFSIKTRGRISDYFSLLNVRTERARTTVQFGGDPKKSDPRISIKFDNLQPYSVFR